MDSLSKHELQKHKTDWFKICNKGAFNPLNPNCFGSMHLVQAKASSTGKKQHQCLNPSKRNWYQLYESLISILPFWPVSFQPLSNRHKSCEPFNPRVARVGQDKCYILIVSWGWMIIFCGRQESKETPPLWEGQVYQVTYHMLSDIYKKQRCLDSSLPVPHRVNTTWVWVWDPHRI